MRNIIPLKILQELDIIEFLSDLSRPRTLTFSVTFQDGFLAHHWDGKPWNYFSLSVLIVSRLCLLVSSLIRVLGSVCQIRILRFSKMQRTHAHTHAHHVNDAKLKPHGPLLIRGKYRVVIPLLSSHEDDSIIFFFFLSFSVNKSQAE